MEDASKFFTVMVVGDNPEELMKPYEIGIEVEKYKKYCYLDAEKMLNKSIDMLKEIVSNKDKFSFNAFQLDCIKEKIKSLQSLTPFEYYSSLTKGLYYDENGDAWSTENPQGKWKTFNIGKNFSVPFTLVDGSTRSQAINAEIAWDEMHMKDVHTYETVWELVMENKKPTNEMEKQLYENMKDKTNYFKTFNNKEEYVIHNCSYWNYAYLDANGWKDMDDENNQVKWIKNFYERFVQPLKETDKITIFECSKKQN